MSILAQDADADADADTDGMSRIRVRRLVQPLSPLPPLPVLLIKPVSQYDTIRYDIPYTYTHSYRIPRKIV